MKHNVGFAALSSFFQILREAFNIFFRNGKLLPSVAIAYVSVNTLLWFSSLFATKHIFTDYTTEMTSMLSNLAGGKAMDPSSSDFAANVQNLSARLTSLMKHEARLFVSVNLVLLTVTATASFIFAVAAISISTGEKLREKVSESWRRALVTVSHTALLNFGFASLMFVLVVLIELFSPNYTAGKLSALSKAAIFVAMVLYCHLAVVWNLAVVVSVVEEKSGFGAFYRASGLVNELKLQGFLVNFLFLGLSYALYKTMRASLGVDEMIGLAPAVTTMSIAPLMVLMAVGSAVKVFELVSYVALYLHGRKICGEEVMELQGYTVEYSKVQADSAKFGPSDYP